MVVRESGSTAFSEVMSLKDDASGHDVELGCNELSQLIAVEAGEHAHGIIYGHLDGEPFSIGMSFVPGYVSEAEGVQRFVEVRVVLMASLCNCHLCW